MKEWFIRPFDWECIASWSKGVRTSLCVVYSSHKAERSVYYSVYLYSNQQETTQVMSERWFIQSNLRPCGQPQGELGVMCMRCIPNTTPDEQQLNRSCSSFRHGIFIYFLTTGSVIFFNVLSCIVHLSMIFTAFLFWGHSKIETRHKTGYIPNRWPAYQSA